MRFLLLELRQLGHNTNPEIQIFPFPQPALIRKGLECLKNLSYLFAEV